MTLSSLSLWIASGIILQLAIYFCVRFWAHWSNYKSLTAHLGEPKSGQELRTSNNLATIAGILPSEFRMFRVDRKVMEDANESICSFYLVPEDGKRLDPFLPGQFLTFRLTLLATHHDTVPSEVDCAKLRSLPQRSFRRQAI
jgi:hypothetical protein